MSYEPYDRIVDEMTTHPYSREQLYDIIFRFFPSYTPESCDWVIGILKQQKKIANVGRGHYIKSKGYYENEIHPQNQKILKQLKKEFPLAEFACIESDTLNGLSGVEEAQSFTLLEVSKRDLFPCYMRLRDLTQRDVMLGPNERELSYYLKPKSIILKPLFSKSPCLDSGQFALEKLVVDCFCDKTIKQLYFDANFKTTLGKILATKNVDVTKMLNYAKRRKIYQEIYDLSLEYLPNEYRALIKEEQPNEDW